MSVVRNSKESIISTLVSSNCNITFRRILLRDCSHISISRIEGGGSLKIYLYDNMGGQC